MHLPVLVVKLGSAVISDEQGNIDERIIRKLAGEIAVLSRSYRVVLVSSGAVSSGKAFFPGYKGTLVERKAAAAVGNPMLIRLYQRHCARYGITVAQALCERHHFSNRLQFLQLKETFREFWSNNILPVVNENDLVSNVELKFSDNDELATLLALGFDAATLVLCTSVGGFLDQDKKIVPLVAHIDGPLLACVHKEKSGLGLGGMLSKITFTNLATSLGIRVVMTGLQGRHPLQRSLQGDQGTTFKPQRASLKARQRWLASGCITLGELLLDEGAVRALRARKSLLLVGVRQWQGNFRAGEVVQLRNPQQEIIGVAKVRLGADQLATLANRKNVLAAHADDIVVFNF